jgi:hypothetical protein
MSPACPNPESCDERTSEVAIAWDEMRQRLMDRVFYNYTEDQVASSSDLVGDGYLDSLSILVTLGVFDEELGEGVASQHARVPDTKSLAALQALYERLVAVGG